MQELELTIASTSYRREIIRLHQLFTPFVSTISIEKFENLCLLYLCDRDISGHEDIAVSQNFYLFLESVNLNLTEYQREMARRCLLEQKAKADFQIMMTYYDFSDKKSDSTARLAKPLYYLIVHDSNRLQEYKICRHRFFILNWLRLRNSLEQIFENMARMKIPEDKLKQVFDMLSKHNIQVQNLTNINSSL